METELVEMTSDKEAEQGVLVNEKAAPEEKEEVTEKVEFLPEKTDKATAEKAGLQKHVGFVGAICLIVGCMIGSGIFASPGVVFKQASSPGMALIVWAGCGLLACFAALSYCELGTAFHHLGGGEHTYLGQAFGPLASFLYSYVALVVIKPTTIAGVSLACGYYIMEPTGNQEMLWRKLIAAGVIGKEYSPA